MLFIAQQKVMIYRLGSGWAYKAGPRFSSGLKLEASAVNIVKFNKLVNEYISPVVTNTQSSYLSQYPPDFSICIVASPIRILLTLANLTGTVTFPKVILH